MNYTDSSQEKIWKPLLYIKALRAPFLAATVLPMALGALLAIKENEGSFFLMALIIICGGLINLATNTLNDYFDYLKGCDSNNVQRTPFSGGSGLIVDGFLTTRDMYRLSFILIFSAFAAGLTILTISPANPFVILLFGLGAIFLGYAYSAPPFNFSSKGLGEVTVFFTCGPLSVMAPYYIISSNFSLSTFIVALPPAFMITAILWINQYPDFETDKKAGKRNLLVRMGREKGLITYFVLVLSAAGALVFSVYASYLPMASLWGLLFFIPLIPATQLLIRNYKNPVKLIPAMAFTIFSQVILSLAMILSVILWSPF